MADAYSGIDFDEINEATGLAPDEIKCLKVRHGQDIIGRTIYMEHCNLLYLISIYI